MTWQGTGSGLPRERRAFRELRATRFHRRARASLRGHVDSSSPGRTHSCVRAACAPERGQTHDDLVAGLAVPGCGTGGGRSILRLPTLGTRRAVSRRISPERRCPRAANVSRFLAGIPVPAALTLLSGGVHRMEFIAIERGPGALQEPLALDQIHAICEQTFGSGATVTSVRELSGGEFNTVYRLGLAGNQ